ncbi:MAG: hypothetical protein K6G89_05255 [Clostridia bacterium]|nr:hypothetical protein [Clostridia bacterium]
MLKNKRGEGYVQVSVLIIAICMILSVFVTFASSVNVVRLTERNSKTVLESYLMKNSIEIYDSIKQGNNDADSLDASEYISDLSDFCTFAKAGSYYYHKDENGRIEYYISKPTVGFTETGKLRLYVSYRLYVPIYFDNIRIRTAQIPITVKIDLEERF